MKKRNRQKKGEYETICLSVLLVLQVFFREDLDSLLALYVSDQLYQSCLYLVMGQRWNLWRWFDFKLSYTRGLCPLLAPPSPAPLAHRQGNTLQYPSCSYMVCFFSSSYTSEDGASNMAVIDFRLQSGYVASKDSLDTLKKEEPSLKRYELDGKSVLFYFDEVSVSEQHLSGLLKLLYIQEQCTTMRWKTHNREPLAAW